MKRNTLVIGCYLILLSGCASPGSIIEIPEPVEEQHVPKEHEKQSGSLWDESAGSMFADHKAKKVGDILTVTISEKSSATKNASTTTDRESSLTAGIPNIFGLETNHYITEDTAIDMSQLLSTNFSNSFSGSGKIVRSGDLTASLTTQVIGVYPNGNLKIRGGKEVMVNNEVQIIYLTGLVRDVDITAANTISSNKILNARITYTGKGVISDKQNPGWLTRTIDNIWPF